MSHVKEQVFCSETDLNKSDSSNILNISDPYKVFNFSLTSNSLQQDALRTEENDKLDKALCDIVVHVLLVLFLGKEGDTRTLDGIGSGERG